MLTHARRQTGANNFLASGFGLEFERVEKWVVVINDV